MAQQTEKTSDPVSFEQALTLLEQIVHDLEEGRLGLAESLARYEEGVKLLRQCHGLLEQAERRVELVTGTDAAGNPVMAPFDDQATFTGSSDEVPNSRRGKTKKRVQQPPEQSDSGSEATGPTMDEPGSLF